jgi:nucleotide-binding universal stress UspA family protein
MESFRNILVDIDSTARAHPALERAILLAKRSRAKRTVADVMTVPPSARGGIPVMLIGNTAERVLRELPAPC